MLKKILTIALAALLLAVPAHAQIIGASGNQGGGNSSYREKGSSLRLEAGWLGAAVGYGYQLNPYVMLGGGFLGYGCDVYDVYDVIHSDIYDWCLMPYAEVRLSTPKQQHAVFLDLRLGPVIGYYLGTMGTLGYMHNNWSFGIGVVGGDKIGVSPVIIVTYSLPFSAIKNIFL